MSALLPHANTESPDATDCNRSLWEWPEFFYEPVSLTYMWHTSAMLVSKPQCQRTAVSK